MCGIAGVLGVESRRARPAAERMRAALRHRGPDGDGLVEVPDPRGEAPPAILVHTRLAVLDPTDAGAQPMHGSGDPPAVVSFNGEIYDFRELRAELERAGSGFRTRSDTEVLLEALRTWGEAALPRLRGMFAFALADPGRGEVWLVRDRLGIKPLYRARVAGGGLLFASELRALLAAGPDLLPPRISPGAIGCYLARGCTWRPDEAVVGVESLGPGELARYDWRGAELGRRSWWSFAPGAQPRAHPWARDDAARELGRTLRLALEEHLVSDVPLGLFLSGGLDSACLATLGSELRADLHTVSVGFDVASLDESGDASAIARALGTTHRVVRLSGTEVLEDLDAALGAVDRPTVDGFNTWFVSRAARRAGLTVALSGLGADELFGGYASFRDVGRMCRLGSLAALAPRPARRVAPLLALLPSRGAAKLAELLRRAPDAVGATLLRRELLLPAERRRLLRLEGPASGIPPVRLEELRSRALGLEPGAIVTLTELVGFLDPMLLPDADVFSMAHGLELRVPYLDHRVVELSASFPAEWRTRGRPKAILAEAVGPRLPSPARGPKRGFTLPWDEWLRGSLRARVDGCIRDPRAWERLGILPRGPVELWERFLARDRRVPGLALLALLVLDRWSRDHGVEVA